MELRKNMRSKIVQGSIILLIGFGIFNFLNFLYQSIMARLLSVADYGVLASLGAIIYILTIFSESIQTTIAKYSTSLENGYLKNIVKKSLRKSRYYATIILGIYLIISIPIHLIISIPYLLLTFNGILIYIMFLLPVTRGALQGRKQFTALSINLIIESIFKLIFGVVFVILGWKIYGAIGGFIFGGVLAFMASFVPLKLLFKSVEKPSKTLNIYKYAKHTIFITTIVTLFSSIDVIIAQIIFEPEISGIYAISSILGKIILWGCFPIGKAMFPLSAEETNNSKNKKILRISILMISFLIISTISFFALFSSQIISIFSGRLIPQAEEILIYLVIAFSFIALSNFILVYQLSKGRTQGYGWLIIYPVIELILLFIPPYNLTKFAISFTISSFIFFIGSIFTMRLKKSEE